jgi:hypothetical protein
MSSQGTRILPSRTGTPQGGAIVRSVNRYEDDATVINVEDRKPIDSRMPHMPPA